jgi:endogenous inhibitor of DNA gyrase (YacG/DUF329 family)
MEASFECAICGRRVHYSGPLPDRYPFCSQRCKLVDLGRWFNEQYSIDRDLTPDDLPDIPRDRREFGPLDSEP